LIGGATTKKEQIIRKGSKNEYVNNNNEQLENQARNL